MLRLFSSGRSLAREMRGFPVRVSPVFSRVSRSRCVRCVARACVRDRAPPRVRPQTSVVAVVNEVARRANEWERRERRKICVLDVSVLVYMGFVCVMYV